jgi:hypothetical protein
MAVARVVSFDGVSEARVAELRQRMSENPRPGEIPATEMMVLHDPTAGSALAILFFDTEDDYQKGDQTLSAMPADETPGSRTSVKKYNVAIRMTG